MKAVPIRAAKAWRWETSALQLRLRNENAREAREGDQPFGDGTQCNARCSPSEPNPRGGSRERVPVAECPALASGRQSRGSREIVRRNPPAQPQPVRAALCARRAALSIGSLRRGGAAARRRAQAPTRHRGGALLPRLHAATAEPQRRRRSRLRSGTGEPARIHRCADGARRRPHVAQPLRRRARGLRRDPGRRAAERGRLDQPRLHAAGDEPQRRCSCCFR